MNESSIPQLRCPRDNTALIAAPDHQCRAHACPQCQGIFIDQNKVDGLRAQAAWHKHVRHPQGQVQLQCPHDGDKLIAFPFKQVEVDVCLRCHGVWLDKNELEKISKKMPAPSPRKIHREEESSTEWGDVFEFVCDAVSAALDSA
jgi:Zn-finger nucleic acid-binding protein